MTPVGHQCTVAPPPWSIAAKFTDSCLFRTSLVLIEHDQAPFPSTGQPLAVPDSTVIYIFTHSHAVFPRRCLHTCNPDWPLLMRLDHVSLLPVFHETSGTLTQIGSTVEILSASLWSYCAHCVLEVHLGRELSGERAA